MILKVGDINVDVVNWDEFTENLLNGIALQLEDSIVQQINFERLVDTGEFKRSINWSVKGNELEISSDAPYGAYLEFGTPGTKKGVVDPFGENSRGPNPSRKMPLQKKGNEFVLIDSLRRWADKHGFDQKSYFLLAKVIQEKGLEPRAPFRRILYNQSRMDDIINKGVKIASAKSII